MTHAHKIFIRTKTEDSVFVYHVLEAQDGLASYSTLAFKSHDPFRDMEILVSPDSVAELEDLLRTLGEMVMFLPGDPSKK